MHQVEKRVDAWVEIEVLDRQLEILYPEDQ
jgi:hypothetical protein